MNGWISLHRQLVDHWLWTDKPFSKGQAWIDLLMLAKHRDDKLISQGKLIDGKRGSVYRSVLFFANRWGWDRKKVKRFLDALECEGMITVNSTTHGTTISIINYSKFQDSGTANETADGITTPQPAGQPLPTYNKDNKENKENKYKYNAPFQAVWEAYPRKKEKAAAYKAYIARLNDGYSEDDLMKATQAYAEECRKLKTEEKYIKQGKTFYGVNTPFADYLKKEVQEDEGRNYDYAGGWAALERIYHK